MRRLILLLCPLLFFVISCGVTKKTDAMVRYADQNNNQYIITSSTFEYKPITEKESSSGTYNGGVPISKAMTSETFSPVLQLAQEILSNAPKDVRREMLTTILSVSTDGISQRATLKKSKKRAAFEALLQELRNSSE
ncbi:hypothetical protein G5B37_06285 [Rasiella rasia]|uniref:Lipoprotein n=1 Tax=Rasiella rasia TaxID=2744027 RepID=A0A6G6GL16_9FLAO|nr:hypothetical protein [Rasiella rasia]QIE59180.1 hypothetical protein G5B37_06285 [Rasiella rasia]